ncbi:MAG: hypothetical protein QOC92_2180 [Acidimicrobiaceae bacterium]
MLPPRPIRHSDGVRLTGIQTTRSTLMTVTAVVAVGLMILGTAVGVGLQWRVAWWRHGPADSTSLDYATLAARLERLRAEYIRSLLGGDATAPVAQAGSSGASGRSKSAAITEVAHTFTNDDLDGAYDIPSVPFRARTDTTGATREASEPSDCSPVGGTAWYRYRSVGDVALFADTFGSAEPTALAVYVGDRPDALSLVGCDLNVLGNAQVGFRPADGATYWFQLTGPAGGGPTVFELITVGLTTVQTIAPSGAPADGISFDRPAISSDGRYVAFSSYAHNLTTNAPECPMGLDFIYCTAVYLRDRVTGVTRVVAGQATSYPAGSGNTIAMFPSMSDDGRYISFSAYEYYGYGYKGASDSEPDRYSAYLYDQLTEQVELVSRNSAGEAARRDPVFNEGVFGGAWNTSVSADGRYVIFNSEAANLGHPLGPGEVLHTYVRDRVTGATRPVLTDASGQPRRGNSCAGSGRNISGDGRFVAYMRSEGPEPVPGNPLSTDATAPWNVYLWDGETGRSRLVSKLPPGTTPQGTYCPAISLDGSHVGMVSRDPLVPEDTNGTPDVYVYDVAADRMTRVSVTSEGQQTVDPSYTDDDGDRVVTLSADGRLIAFDSAAVGLAPGGIGSTGQVTAGEPGLRQAYVHDLVTGATVLASVSSTGETLPGGSTLPYIASDGSAVVFMHTVAGFVDVVVHELR